MRIDGWEKRLKDVVEKHIALPSKYGVSDCYLIADDAVEAVTGARMYLKALGYKTPAGAGKKLRKHGFSNVEEAFAAKFRPVAPSLAQRGDIGVVERDGEIAGGVFTVLGFMTRGRADVLFLPVSDVKAAFKVD